jgi:hypothetical protein
VHVDAEVGIAGRPDREVEVIGHDTETDQPHREAGGRVRQEADESVVVVVGVEDFGAAIAAIERVVAEAARGSACSAWHRIREEKGTS